MTNIPMAEVRKHASKNSTWIVINNDVYDVTKFLKSHPGGADTLLEWAGKDGTQAFMDVGHSTDAQDMMKKYKIGSLPNKERKFNIDPCGVSSRSSRASNRSWRSYDGSSDVACPSNWTTIAAIGALILIIGFVGKRYLM